MYDADTIIHPLMGWMAIWADNVDGKIGMQLFTDDTTVMTAEAQIKKVRWIVDFLSNDGLYYKVKPGGWSTTGLSTYISSWGVESKLEKGASINGTFCKWENARITYRLTRTNGGYCTL